MISFQSLMISESFSVSLSDYSQEVRIVLWQRGLLRQLKLKRCGFFRVLCRAVGKGWVRSHWLLCSLLGFTWNEENIDLSISLNCIYLSRLMLSRNLGEIVLKRSSRL